MGWVPIAGNAHVYYLDSATEADARSLAATLRDQNAFAGGSADVFISKEHAGTSVLIPVREGAWNNSRQVSWLKQIVRRAAPSVGGLPVTLRLLDTSLQPRKDVIVNLRKPACNAATGGMLCFGDGADLCYDFQNLLPGQPLRPQFAHIGLRQLISGTADRPGGDTPP